MKHSVVVANTDFVIDFKWSPMGGHTVDLDSAVYGNVMFDGVKCHYVGRVSPAETGGWNRPVQDLSVANCPGGQDALRAKGFNRWTREDEKVLFDWHQARQAMGVQLTDQLVVEVEALCQNADFMRQAELEFQKDLLNRIGYQRRQAEDTIAWATSFLERTQARIDALDPPETDEV